MKLLVGTVPTNKKLFVGTRVERSFCTLKDSIRARFPTLPVIERSVIHLISFCDQQITVSATQASLKSFQIYDTDPDISAVNHEASLKPLSLPPHTFEETAGARFPLVSFQRFAFPQQEP